MHNNLTHYVNQLGQSWGGHGPPGPPYSYSTDVRLWAGVEATLQADTTELPQGQLVYSQTKAINIYSYSFVLMNSVTVLAMNTAWGWDNYHTHASSSPQTIISVSLNVI